MLGHEESKKISSKSHKSDNFGDLALIRLELCTLVTHMVMSIGS